MPMPEIGELLAKLDPRSMMEDKQHVVVPRGIGDMHAMLRTAASKKHGVTVATIGCTMCSPHTVK